MNNDFGKVYIVNKGVFLDQYDNWNDMVGIYSTAEKAASYVHCQIKEDIEEKEEYSNWRLIPIEEIIANMGAETEDEREYYEIQEWEVE